MDRYTKFILRAIAVLLALNLCKPFFIPGEAVADLKYQRVNVTHVDGNPVHYPLRVYIAGSKWEIAPKDKELAMLTEK